MLLVLASLLQPRTSVWMDARHCCPHNGDRSAEEWIWGMPLKQDLLMDGRDRTAAGIASLLGFNKGEVGGGDKNSLAGATQLPMYLRVLTEAASQPES